MRVEELTAHWKKAFPSFEQYLFHSDCRIQNIDKKTLLSILRRRIDKIDDFLKSYPDPFTLRELLYTLYPLYPFAYYTPETNGVEFTTLGYASFSTEQLKVHLLQIHNLPKVQVNKFLHWREEFAGKFTSF